MENTLDSATTNPLLLWPMAGLLTFVCSFWLALTMLSDKVDFAVVRLTL
jgi:hypothetical protein